MGGSVSPDGQYDQDGDIHHAHQAFYQAGWDCQAG
jgi:hypothetical protein